MTPIVRHLAPWSLWLLALSGCVSKAYQPGAADNPMNRLKLGQNYGDMVNVLGAPDQSRSENRSGTELASAFVPVWGLAEWAGDFNPSAIQIYTYRRWGTVTIGNNRIMRVEAKDTSKNGNP